MFAFPIIISRCARNPTTRSHPRAERRGREQATADVLRPAVDKALFSGGERESRRPKRPGIQIERTIVRQSGSISG
jgi:hypothetical protein